MGRRNHPVTRDTVLLDYEALIQPILDRRCVRCHGGGKPKGGLDFTPAKDGTPFCRSFRTMFPRKKGKKPLVSVSNRFSDSSVTKPKQFGSHRSRLVLKLLKDRKHRAASKLTGGEWKTLVAWVDANAPYYGSYIDKRPGDGGTPRRVRITMKPPFPEPEK